MSLIHDQRWLVRLSKHPDIGYPVTSKGLLEKASIGKATGSRIFIVRLCRPYESALNVSAVLNFADRGLADGVPVARSDE